MVLYEAYSLSLINSFFNGPTLYLLTSEMSALAIGKSIWIFPKEIKSVLVRPWITTLVYTENVVTLIYIRHEISSIPCPKENDLG